MTDRKRIILHQPLNEYNLRKVEDIQDTLKELLGGTIKEMMEAEIEDPLGYRKSEHSDNDNCRNGYKPKHIHSSYGGRQL